MRTNNIRWYKVASYKGGIPSIVAAANAYEAGDIAHKIGGMRNPVRVWSISSATRTEIETVLERYWAGEEEVSTC